MVSDNRICPECGSDIYRASHYDEMNEARARHQRENERQAIEILRLRLEVEELKDWRRRRNRKIEQQRRTIKRLETRLRELGARPHEDKRLGGGEGDPASPSGSVIPPPSAEPPTYPSPRGLRKLRRNKEATTDA